MMANPPATLGMAVDLPDPCVDADSDCADESRLAEVGSEARPEVVVQVRPTVERSRVKCQPVLDGAEERNEKDDPHQQKEEEEAKSQSPRFGSSPGFRDTFRVASDSGLGQR